MPSLDVIPHTLTLKDALDGKWLHTAGLSLALGPGCATVAVAHNNEVAVFELQAGKPAASSSSALFPNHSASNPSDPGPQLLGASTSNQDTVTALLWLRFDGEAAEQAVLQGSSTTAPAPSHSLRSSTSTSISCLLVGTSSGYLQLHDCQGAVLLRQRVHTGPLLQLQLRTGSMGLSASADAGAWDAADITAVFPDAVVCITAASVRGALLACMEARAGQQQGPQGALSSAMAWATGTYTAPEVPPISCSKWDMPRALRHRTDAVCMGQRPADLYSVLQGHAMPSPRVLLVTAGDKPCLAALDAHTHKGPRTTFSALVGTASSLATGIWGAARSAREQVVQGPSALKEGIKSFMRAPLFSMQPPQRHAPLCTYDDPAAACGKGEPSPSVWRVIRDDARVVGRLVPAPAGPLLLALDSLGRVMLLSAAHMGVLRMWKGYRDAECGWLQVPATAVEQLSTQAAQLGSGQGASEKRGSAGYGGADAAEELEPGTGAGPYESMDRVASVRSPISARPAPCDTVSDPPGAGPAAGSATALPTRSVLIAVLHAPRRQVLELWLPHHGPRLASIPVGPAARLLQVPAVLQASGAACDVVHSPSCVLLDAAEGRVVDVLDAALALVNKGAAV